MATETITNEQSENNAYESAGRSADDRVRRKTRMGALHWLTLGSIAASLMLYMKGKNDMAFFIGLWPPTFLALKSASQTSNLGGTRRREKSRGGGTEESLPSTSSTQTSGARGLS